MTALDDALNSATPIFDAATLIVEWDELPAGESGGKEDLQDMSDVLSGQYAVEQSFDDALPDDVTMTGSNDACGKFEGEVIGRQGHTFATWATPTSSFAENAYASTFIGTTLPSGLIWGTQLVMAVVVPSATAMLTQGDLEGTKFAWDFLGKQTDGTVAIWLYTKRAYSGIAAPEFYSDVSVSNTAYACIGFRANDPAGNELRWRMVSQVQSAASSSITVHSLPNMVSDATRTVFYGFWASLGPATWTTSETSMAMVSTPTVSLQVSRSGLWTGPLSKVMTSTRSAASDVVAMFGIGVEPFERPNMTPTEFWSPFNEDSPVVDLERDTAHVQTYFNVLTESGITPTQLFDGQMDDVELGTDNQVTMKGSSLVRTTLNKSVNLPMVFGRREGGAIDFLNAWIAARADRFIGPAPGYLARWWVPCYGSIHDGLGGPLGYNYGMYWTPTLSNIGLRNPTFVTGPHHSGVFACHTATYTQEIVLNAIDLWKNQEIWPWVKESYLPSEYAQDLFSFDNSAGRVTFWVRGDATYAGTPPNVPAGNRYLFSFVHQMKSPTGTTLAQIWIFMEPTDRNLYLQLGNDTDGYTTLFYGGSLSLPSDGAWHMYSVSWSWVEGSFKVRRNGSTGTQSFQWDTDGRNGYTGWYDTEEDLYAAGGSIVTYFRSHLPLSDFYYEAGWNAYSSSGTDVWPTHPWPSYTMTTRRTGFAVAAVPDDSPVNAWETLAELARNTMSWYRATEADGLIFAPPAYWGETEQQTSAWTLDTAVNVQELEVTADPSKSRNVVTVQFPETTVDIMYSTCLAMTTSTEIPPGINDVVFTLDSSVAEIHGAATPFAAVWTLTNLTSTQIAAGTGAAYNIHYMAVNTLADGSGTVLEERSVLGVIMSYTQTTVTIRFNNKTGRAAYLANNYQGDNQLPSLRILGYLIKQTDAYATERDGGSIGTRRERAMEVEMPWIHDRFTAQQFASQMVALLAHPRHEVIVEAMGDPRRKPGDLITLVDEGSTKASGNWRILSVKHNADGPGFTQTLQLLNVLPVGVWDQTNWDQSAWGA